MSLLAFSICSWPFKTLLNRVEQAWCILTLLVFRFAKELLMLSFSVENFCPQNKHRRHSTLCVLKLFTNAQSLTVITVYQLEIFLLRWTLWACVRLEGATGYLAKSAILSNMQSCVIFSHACFPAQQPVYLNFLWHKHTSVSVCCKDVFGKSWHSPFDVQYSTVL